MIIEIDMGFLISLWKSGAIFFRSQIQFKYNAHDIELLAIFVYYPFFATHQQTINLSYIIIEKKTQSITLYAKS